MYKEATQEIKDNITKPTEYIKLALSSTNRAFTGHESIEGTDGLIHMNGRVYDSSIGRFLSADPHIQDPYDTQSYNRYTYVRNNPLNLTDPSGYSWLSDRIDKIVGTVMVVAAFAIMVASVVLAPATGGLSLSMKFVVSALLTSGTALMNGDMHMFNKDENGNRNFSFKGQTTVNFGGRTFSEQIASITSSEAYFNADLANNHKYMNGGATESFERALISLAKKNHRGERIVITKILDVNRDPIDPSQLSPEMRKAYWMDQDSDGMEYGIIPFVAFGRATKFINSGGLTFKKVYRVYGAEAKPNGYSWTDVNPNFVKHYRDAAGLPDVNTGRFVIEGTVRKLDIMKTREALPLDGNRGGLNELIINPRNVYINRVSGANPEF